MSLAQRRKMVGWSVLCCELFAGRLPLYKEDPAGSRRSPARRSVWPPGGTASEVPWVVSSVTFRLLHSDDQACPMGSASFQTLLNGLTVIPLSHLSYLLWASGCRPKACRKRGWRLEMPVSFPQQASNILERSSTPGAAAATLRSSWS